MCSPRTQSFEMSGKGACTIAKDCSTLNQKMFSRFGITHQLLLLGAPYDIQAFEDNTQQEIWSGPDLLHTSHKLSCLLLQKWLGWYVPLL
jgi:hypothetical protein